jgi:hypothetical protein
VRWQGQYQGCGSVLAQTPMKHIENHAYKDSVYFTDIIRDYQFLQRLFRNLIVNHPKEFMKQRIKNHINGILGS